MRFLKGKISERIQQRPSDFKLCSPVRSTNPPSWHDTKEVPFFQQVKRLIEEKSIEFLIDIHGMVDGFEDSVVIGNAGAKVKSILAEELKKWLDQNGVRSAINFTRTPEGKKEWFRGGDFVKNISIPALQLEVTHAYRTCEQIQKLSRFLADFLGSKFERTKSARP